MTALIIIVFVSALLFYAYATLIHPRDEMTLHELTRTTKNLRDKYRDKAEGKFISNCSNWAPRGIPDWSHWDKE